MSVATCDEIGGESKTGETMLKEVSIGSMLPNPYRRLEEYPIRREKVDALKESIETTGFWGTIVARPAGDMVEIAFGHHRMTALKELYSADVMVPIIVRDLSNEEMIRMMTRENMEEWGTDAWVELESVRSTIEAYGRDEIRLPSIPAKARKDLVRHVSQTSGTHAYTRATVAEFLGWTRGHNGSTIQPDAKCELAFDALDLIDEGLIREDQLKGCTRDQMRVLVQGAKSIRQSQLREAEWNSKAAEEAKKQAAKATEDRERKRREYEAAQLEQQAQIAKANAEAKAKRYVEQGAKQFRSGEGVRAVKAEAQQYKPATNGRAVPSVDKFVDQLVSTLSGIARSDGPIEERLRLLMSVPASDVSDRKIEELDQAFESLKERLEGYRNQIVVWCTK